MMRRSLAPACSAFVRVTRTPTLRIHGFAGEQLAGAVRGGGALEEIAVRAALAHLMRCGGLARVFGVVERFRCRVVQSQMWQIIREHQSWQRARNNGGTETTGGGGKKTAAARTAGDRIVGHVWAPWVFSCVQCGLADRNYRSPIKLIYDSLIRYCALPGRFPAALALAIASATSLGI